MGFGYFMYSHSVVSVIDPWGSGCDTPFHGFTIRRQWLTAATCSTEKTSCSTTEGQWLMVASQELVSNERIEELRGFIELRRLKQRLLVLVGS